MKLTIYTDGGSRGNPGPSGIGAVIYNEKKEIIKEISKYIGQGTNNQAEYQALLTGLEEVKKLGASEVDIFMDSELVIKQLKQEYKVRDKHLAVLFVKIWNILQDFKKHSLNHVLREKNKRADDLVNKALDKEMTS